MVFLDSDTIRPLYDVYEGGKPHAFRCMIWCLGTNKEELIRCNKVTKTIGDMVQHQNKKHGRKAQEEISFEEIKPTIA